MVNNLADALIVIEEQAQEIDRLRGESRPTIRTDNSKVIAELEKRNEYLERQNKAFQEQYYVSGELVNGLMDKNKRLREALEYYGNYKSWDLDNYGNSDVHYDSGSIAREALKGE
jgi:hypothetical protein